VAHGCAPGDRRGDRHVPCGNPLETRIEVTNTSAASNFEDGLMTLAWYRILAPSAPG
jgi:hypothetical protein